MRKLEGLDRIREQVRERDDFTCQNCGRVWQSGQRRFDVHHLDITMESIRNYAYDKENIYLLITLCHKCHLNMPHNRAKIRKTNLSTYKAIYQMWLDGVSITDIGDWFWLTKQRVWQIIETYPDDY
jgi:5-methylcytosine-specific restriction endonuclease McrA